MVWATSRTTLGSWGDCTTVEGFLIHFLRQEYGTFKLFSGDEQTEGLVERLHFYSRDLSLQSLGTGLALVPLGALSLLVPARRAANLPGAFRGVMLLAAYVFYQIVFHALANLPLQSSSLKYGVHQRFWMQPHIIAFMWTGALLIYLAGLLPKSFFSPAQRTMICVSFALALVSSQVLTHYEVIDQSDNYQVREYGRISLEHMPRDSLLLTHGDVITNAPRYLLHFFFFFLFFSPSPSSFFVFTHIYVQCAYMQVPAANPRVPRGHYLAQLGHGDLQLVVSPPRQLPRRGDAQRLLPPLPQRRVLDEGVYRRELCKVLHLCVPRVQGR
jgi:hypothetical protein